MSRFVALTLWSFAVWVLLTWTLTAEQLIFGAGIAILVAVVCAPLGDVAFPWKLFSPRRAFGLVTTAVFVIFQVIRANVSLARRVWTPSRPLQPGMVIVRTTMRQPGALTAVGLLTSLVVDNQIVDLDVDAGELQFHVLADASRDPDVNREHTSGPLERRLKSWST